MSEVKKYFECEKCGERFYIDNYNQHIDIKAHTKKYDKTHTVFLPKYLVNENKVKM